jgi:hypothetical protein
MARKITLISSDNKKPKIELKPGQKLDVFTISVRSPSIKGKKKIGARLCGGTSTCLAMIELED